MQCIGEVMSKHEVAKGKYTVIGAVEGQKTSVDIKVCSASRPTASFVAALLYCRY